MKQKIGIDFHGVITALPQNFSIFCHEIRKRDIEVYIISGGPKEDIQRYLDSYSIEYDHIWAIIDYCTDIGVSTFYDDGTFQVPTDIWDKAKAEYCAQQQIKFHIDDSSIYGKYFVTPYCKYQLESGVCSLNDKLKVDFNTPSEAAKIIASFLKDLK
jgi:hypothetical protein